MSPRKSKVNAALDLIRNRINAWEEQDPSSLLTRQIEKATAPLQWLVELLLPETVIHETIDKTLWAAEALTDRDEIFKSLNVLTLQDVQKLRADQCDAVAEKIHNWGVGGAAALGAWDIAGPLGIAPSLLSIFTLAFRTIKRIGLCYGYDTSVPFEEIIVLEIFTAGATLYHKDKAEALRAIDQVSSERARTGDAAYSREAVTAMVDRISRGIGLSLTKRRTFASVPALGALVGSSTNAWLINDIAWAARNIYSRRKLADAATAAKAAEAAKTAAQSTVKAA